MSTTIKTGLVLSGGGASGSYESGVVKALAEYDVQIDMVSGASIGAINGVIVASSKDLHEAAVRLEELWSYLSHNKILSVNREVYYVVLKKLVSAMKSGTEIAMKSGNVTAMAGTLLRNILGQVARINEFENISIQPLLDDGPLMQLMERYFDAEALAKGLPLYVSLYPSESVIKDLIDCIRAESGTGDTRDSIFQHIQSLDPEEQKYALLASAALPLLYRPREIQGRMYCDGGIGGWKKMQGNTPVQPLVDAGCNLVIVTHLSDGSLWDRQNFSDTTIIEIRPRRSLNRKMFCFTDEYTGECAQLGYDDTILSIERIRNALLTRQKMKRSEVAYRESLEGNYKTDSALKDAMNRMQIKG